MIEILCSIELIHALKAEELECDHWIGLSWFLRKKEVNIYNLHTTALRTVSWVASGDDAACAFLSLKTHYHWNVQTPLDVHHVGMLRIWLGIVDDFTARRSPRMALTVGKWGWSWLLVEENRANQSNFKLNDVIASTRHTFHVLSDKL